ncbi:MAG: hypothetical protein OIF50_14680, partial [Flavobacteriaceae bacterium]|nr:hypothetical protein [Flavobacteriaceae bacterium]
MTSKFTSKPRYGHLAYPKQAQPLAKVRQAALWLLFLFFSINLQAQSTATLSVANHGIESDSPTDITGTVTLNQAASGDTTFNL